MKMHAGLSGHTEWQVLDAAGRVVDSGEHHNLITNAGLDGFMSGITAPEDARTRYYGDFRSVPSVGIGNTPPTVDKTALERVVTTTYGSSEGEQKNKYAIEGDYAVGYFTQVRRINFTASHNLTEYGLSATRGGPLHITELFRDAQGTPIVLTVQPGFVLRLSHTLKVKLPLKPQSGVLDLGDGAQSIQAGFLVAETQLSDLFALFSLDRNRALHRLRTRGLDVVDIDPVGLSARLERQVYVPGSYRITDRLTLEAMNGVGQWYGLAITYYGNPAASFRLMYDSYTLQKTDSQRLTLDYTFSWGRA